MSSQCPICRSPADTGNCGDGRQYACPRCGPYIMSGTARAMLGSRLEDDPRAFSRISHAIRHLTSQMQWLRIDSANLDELARARLPSVAQQTLNLLRWIGEQVGDDRLGYVAIDAVDLAGFVGVTEEERIRSLLKDLQQRSLVSVADDTVRLTPAGWTMLETEAPETAMPSPMSTASPHANPAVETAHCPTCGGSRRAEIVAGHTEYYQGENDPTTETVSIRTLRCCGCATLYVRRDAIFSEDEDHEQDPLTGAWRTVACPRTTYWPSAARRDPPSWLGQVTDPVLHQLFDETYQALNADLRTLAAMGVRAVLDRTLELAGADAAAGFAEKLSALTETGAISASERDTLTIMTDAGSAASHRGWQPSPEALDTILDASEAMLFRVAVQPARAQRLRGAVPPRPVRQRRPPR